MSPVTDEQLRDAWLAAVAHRGRKHAVLDRVVELTTDAKTLPQDEREAARWMALALLREIGPD